MLSKAILAAIMAAAPLASAQFAFVNGITAPKNLGAGQNFSVSVSSEDTSQRIENIAIIFGLTPVGTEHPGTLGNEVLREAYLGPQFKGNNNTQVPFSMYVPTGFAKGEAVLSATVLSLASDYHAPYLDFFNATVTIGDTTEAAGEKVRSEKATSVFYG